MRPFIALFVCLFTVACSTTQSLQTLREVEPQGTAFDKALVGEYLKLAQQKEDEHEWQSSQYYADKGLSLAYGGIAEPDPLPTVVNDERRKELTEGQTLFGKYVTEKTKSSYPDLAARIQVLYDCWVGEAGHAASRGQVGFCQQEFYKALQLMDHTQLKDIGGSPVVSTSYLLFFDWDSAQLTKDAIGKISKIIADIQQMGNVTVTVNGHTDRSGTESYNLGLSQKRAEIVKSMLLRGGVAEAIISLFAFGESDPAVNTADGERNPENRRVEVFVE